MDECAVTSERRVFVAWVDYSHFDSSICKICINVNTLFLFPRLHRMIGPVNSGGIF